MSGTAQTTHFGLTRVGNGENISKNGYAALDGDRVRLDSLLYAFLTHVHDGSPALGDPTDPPTLTGHATGGSIPAGTTLYYRVAFMDEHNLETAASTEASITTDPVIDVPSGPALAILTTGGTVGTGSYSYALTYVDAQGGESTGSPISTVSVTSGTTNSIQLTLPTLPTGAVKYYIYRTRPGQTYLYKLAQVTSGTSYTDTGVAEDQTITIPTVNSTNSTNSVDVEIPLAFIPEGCQSWKIYRATSSNGYTGTSLVHQVVETASDISSEPVTTWTDTGDTLFSGFPLEVSSTVPQGSVLDLSAITGSLPLASLPRGGQSVSAHATGLLTNGQTVLVTEAPGQIKPVRFTAYFATPPTNTGVTVTLTVADTASHTVTLACSPTTHVTADPAGYFHVEYPLLEAATFQAEIGTIGGSTAEIDNDVAASSGQAVSLSSNADNVKISLGVLDTGQYSTFVTLRVLAYDTAMPGNDLTISVIRTDTSATIGSPVTLNLQSSDPSDPTSVPADFLYLERTGPVITAPGGVELALKIAKSTTSVQSYDVDVARYHATIPTLSPGMITATATVTGGTTDAADLNMVLWF